MKTLNNRNLFYKLLIPHIIGPIKIIPYLILIYFFGLNVGIIIFILDILLKIIGWEIGDYLTKKNIDIWYLKMIYHFYNTRNQKIIFLLKELRKEFKELKKELNK